jgi:hypothetical protein
MCQREAFVEIDPDGGRTYFCRKIRPGFVEVERRVGLLELDMFILVSGEQEVHIAMVHRRLASFHL